MLYQTQIHIVICQGSGVSSDPLPMQPAHESREKNLVRGSVTPGWMDQRNWVFIKIKHAQKKLKCFTLSIKNHWMDQENPWSQWCKRNSLSNEGIFMILPSQYFPGSIKRYVSVHFSKENTVWVSLEGNSLGKSTRYSIVIYFQWGIIRPNRPIFNLMNHWFSS